MYGANILMAAALCEEKKQEEQFGK